MIRELFSVQINLELKISTINPKTILCWLAWRCSLEFRENPSAEFLIPDPVCIVCLVSRSPDMFRSQKNKAIITKESNHFSCDYQSESLWSHLYSIILAYTSNHSTSFNIYHTAHIVRWNVKFSNVSMTYVFLREYVKFINFSKTKRYTRSPNLFLVLC